VSAASSIWTVHQCRDVQTGNAPVINQIYFKIFHQRMHGKNLQEMDPESNLRIKIFIDKNSLVEVADGKIHFFL
jgi:hypothetical protein